MNYKFALTAIILICYNNAFANTPSDTTYTGAIRKDSLSMFIFGNYDSKSNFSVWKTKSQNIKKSFSLSNKASSVSIYAKIVLFDSLTIKGQKQVIIVTQNAPLNYKCQSCSPILAVYLFQQSGPSTWQLKHRSLFAQEGNWGVASEVKLITEKDNNFFIITNPGVTQQGITKQDLHLFALINNDFKKVLLFKDFVGNNYGNCDEKKDDCWSFKSIINLSQNKENDNANVEIDTIGTDENDKGLIVKVNKVIKFKFDGNKYIVTK